MAITQLGGILPSRRLSGFIKSMREGKGIKMKHNSMKYGKTKGILLGLMLLLINGNQLWGYSPAAGDWAKYKVVKNYFVTGGNFSIRIADSAVKFRVPKGPTDWEKNIVDLEQAVDPSPIEEAILTIEVDYNINMRWYMGGGSKHGKIVYHLPAYFFAENFYQDMVKNGSYIYDGYSRITLTKVKTITHALTKESYETYFTYLETFSNDSKKISSSGAGYPIDTEYHFNPQTSAIGWLKPNLVVRGVPFLGSFKIPLRLSGQGRTELEANPE